MYRYHLIILMCAITFAVQKNAAQNGDLLFPSGSFDSTFVVTGISVIGNEATKEYLIIREMTLQPGKVISQKAIDYDKNRIYSLQLFNKVDIDVVPDSSGAELLVTVSERWYFYPYPIVGIKDHDWSKIYYGGGLVHNNFRGENVQLYSQFALGYDPFASINYSNPLINREHNLFFNTRIYYNVSRNRSILSKGMYPDFDEERYGGSIGMGKRLSLFSLCHASVEYTMMSISDNRSGRTLSADGNDNYFSFSFSYSYDTRDLAEYPSEGLLLSAGAAKYGVPGRTVDYQRYSGDVRAYQPLIGGFTGSCRLFLSMAGGGKVPNYGHVYLGYGDKIRGHYNTIFEGEEIAGSTVEFHYPLISPRFIRIEEIPLEQFRVIRYAVYAAFFADAGSVWYRRQPFAADLWKAGYGAGLHFLFSYSAVLRIEYAFNTAVKNSGEFIIDIGAAL